MDYSSLIKKLFQSREYIFRTPLTPAQCQWVLKHRLGNSEYPRLRGCTSEQGFSLWIMNEQYYNPYIQRVEFFDPRDGEFNAQYVIDSDRTTIIKGHFEQSLPAPIIFLLLNLFFLIVYASMCNARSQGRDFPGIAPYMPLFGLVVSTISSVAVALFNRFKNHRVTEFIKDTLVKAQFSYMYTEE